MAERGALTVLQLLREIVDLLRLTVFMPEQDRTIAVYSRESSYYLHYETIIAELRQNYDCQIIYVTADPHDPLLRSQRDGLRVLYINALAPTLMRLLHAKVLITTVPDLGRLSVPRPRLETRLVYVFHSIFSTHVDYRLGAFDDYDTIFCVGPHHNRELRRHSEIYEVPKRALVNVGYPKLDQMARSYRRYARKHRTPAVLVASGWGSSNVLSDLGEAIIGRLLNTGYRVIVRPHPELRRRRPRLIRDLRNLFQTHPRFELEPDITSVESLFEADVMISDWSGVAFEYAFATERPVVSIDLPRMVKNPEWGRLGMASFEDFGRRAIGPVVAVDDLPDLERKVDEALLHQDTYKAGIRDLRSAYVYNLGCSSRVAAAYLHGLLRSSSPTRQPAGPLE